MAKYEIPNPKDKVKLHQNHSLPSIVRTEEEEELPKFKEMMNKLYEDEEEIK
jgi:hypothetical protein